MRSLPTRSSLGGLVRLRTLFLLFPLFALQPLMTSCAECQYDDNCPQEGYLCEQGTCKQKEKPPDRRINPADCLSGEKRPCYSGLTGTEGKGICKSGNQSCLGGTWGPCEGEVKPASPPPGKQEACDGIDNNCNGEVDEECGCKDGNKQKCFTGSANTRNKGICKDGEQTCVDGQWGKCLDQKLPQAEKCDNIDNDCDGQIDNEVKRPCKSKCGPGFEICDAGQWKACDAPQPSEEKCGDKKDNNCDGGVDEGCDCDPGKTQSCYGGPPNTSGNAPCQEGTQTCSAAGKWPKECSKQVIPRLELCDNIDNDCNGRIDDNLKRACQRGCNTGSEVCHQGIWKVCDAAPADAEICNGKDDDCNGKVDDLSNGTTCECRVGQKELCYSGPASTRNTLPCKGGERTCQSTGKWSVCLNQVIPQTEICNGKDDDCDGQIDNTPKTSNSLQQKCYRGAAGTAGKGICKEGTQTCNAGKWSACQGEVTPTAETCNGKDDNCNGQIDEKLQKSCYTGANGTAGKGACKEGTQTCNAGKWSTCTGEVTPKLETCNGKDDNCDGQADEPPACVVCTSGQTRPCYNGPTNTRGNAPCKDGTETCLANGMWGTCLGEIKPTAETCNNKDDDCDGKIDGGSRQCTTACGKGTETCNAGQYTGCNAPKPTAETCNQLDDDCNGKIDDGVQCSILATSDWSGKIYLWNPYSQKLSKTLNNSFSRINVLRFSPDRKLLAVGNGLDVRIWDHSAGKLLKTVTTSSNVRALAFSSDSKTIAAGLDADQVWIIDASTGTVRAKNTSMSANLYGLAFHPQNKWLAALSGSASYKVYFINPADGKLINTLSLSGDPTSLDLHPNGNTLAISTGSGKSVDLWNVASLPGTKIKSLPFPDYIYTVRFSPDGSLLSAAGYSACTIWNSTTHAQLHRFNFSGTWVYSSHIDPDNKLVAFTGRIANNNSGHLWLYDITLSTPTQKLYDSTTHTNNYARSVSFSP